MRAAILVMLVGFCMDELVRSDAPIPKATEGVSTTPNVLQLGTSSDLTTKRTVTTKVDVVGSSSGSTAGQYGSYGGNYQAYRSIQSPSLSYYTAPAVSPVATSGQYAGYGAYPMMGIRSMPYTALHMPYTAPASMNQQPISQPQVEYYNTYNWPSAVKGTGYGSFDYTKYQSGMNQYGSNIGEPKSAQRLASRGAQIKSNGRLYGLEDSTVDVDIDAGILPATSKQSHFHAGHLYKPTTSVCEKPPQDAIPVMAINPIMPMKKPKPTTLSFLSLFG